MMTEFWFDSIKNLNNNWPHIALACKEMTIIWAKKENKEIPKFPKIGPCYNEDHKEEFL